MYLLDIDISGLKLLRDFRLSLRDAQGQPRMWTVLIGENGLCKTSILQAIAMAASGYVRANQLADVPSLPDRRRLNTEVQIQANFTFSETHHQEHRSPGLRTSGDQNPYPHSPLILTSSLSIAPGHNIFKGHSRYRDVDTDNETDPIEQVRATDYPWWFVAGYGTTRSLPTPLARHKADDASLNRVNSLFDRGQIIGTGFANLLYRPRSTSGSHTTCSITSSQRWSARSTSLNSASPHPEPVTRRFADSVSPDLMR